MQAKKNTYESFYEFTKAGAAMGVGLRTVENEFFDGRIVELDGKSKVFFGNCSYLGLETDDRVKAGAIESIQKHGICLSCSRHYLSIADNDVLLGLLEKMFDKPCLLMPLTNLASSAIITTRVKPTDAIILDYQVHTSVRIASHSAKVTGTHIETLAHNRMDLLEDRIKALSVTHDDVWYMADGVYSMFGDLAPMRELYRLMDTYPNFKVFIDEAHGLSWIGEKGIGSSLNQVGYFHDQLYIVSSLAKAFGGQGGVAIFPNEKERDIVKMTSPQHIFLSPLNNAIIGANIACAKIHLSDELAVIQSELMQKIELFKKTAKSLRLPLANPNATSPIFYIGTGTSELALTFMQKLFHQGFYVNVATNPLVPKDHAGMRIVLSRHLTDTDIKALLYLIYELNEELMPQFNISSENIAKAFEPYFMY